MSAKVTGNTTGLAPSEHKRVERLFSRKLYKDELISLELAREIWGIAADLRRRVGVLASREGHIEEVFLGTKDLLYLPDIGRYRLGRGRLRRLRLLFTDLSRAEEPHLPSDIFADLELLRLDMVVGIKGFPNRMAMAFAHMVPPVEESKIATHTELIPDIAKFEFDFASFMAQLEDELSQYDAAHVAKSGDGALLVGVYGRDVRNVEASLSELKELARTAGVEVLGSLIQRRQPDPRTLLGKGKLQEVILTCLRLGAGLIIFDMELKPGQWRSVTNATELKVIDRSMLILDIFAQHATSSEGRLQVELAQLKYNLPRLVEKDAGLSRLTGGIGGRGPGETKLEIARRRVRDRIVELEKRTNTLSQQRHLRRSKRQDNRVPLVSILGYTNAGKSTLFNALTRSDVVVENKLFSTLDPAQRKLVLAGDLERGIEDLALVLSDTVGFIRELPEELVSAFRATLEELAGASLLLHVLDAADNDIHSRRDAVSAILAELQLGDIPVLVVINKIDKIPAEQALLLAREFGAVPVSAQEKQGLDILRSSIREKLRGGAAAPYVVGSVVT